MPLSEREIKQIFGEFDWTDSERSRGRIVPDPEWVRRNIVLLDPPFPMWNCLRKPLRKIRCHVLVADQVLAVLRGLRQTGQEHLIQTWDGCFVPRHMGWDPKRALSRHSWGVACDVNASRFPYGSKRQQDHRLVGMWQLYGFESGGNWRTPDPMHFECVRLRGDFARPYKLIVNDRLAGSARVENGAPVAPIEPLLREAHVLATVRVRPDQGKVYVYTRNSGRRE